MEQDKSKQIAPQVVLAQHGNKDAMRNIYIQYHKNIFFISKVLTGNTSSAMALTVQIFAKMFESVDKLDDHMAFERWFYSLAISFCRAQMNNEREDRIIVTEDMIAIAKNASDAAKSGDKYGFERSVMKLFEEMICALPDEAKVIFFYRNTAMLDSQQIALLEKTQEDVVEKSITAVDILFEKQIETLKKLGVDMAPFVKDVDSTLSHLFAKTFVPGSVHASVTEKTGINADPFADKKENETPVAEKKPQATADKKKVVKKQKEKKSFFSRSDVILFIVVALISLIIFSGVKIYRNAKNEQAEAGNQEVETVVKPVLTWNGAATSSFASGSGKEDDPYIITSGGELAYLANLVNSGNSLYAQAYYKLVCDVVLNDTSDYDSWGSFAPENRWTPIGGTEDAVPFSGSFDGNGYSVKGMYISGDYVYSGLFGEVANGCIENVVVENAYVYSADNCGGIAGYIHSDKLMGTDIRACAFAGKIYSSGSNAGGIAGSVSADGDENFMTIEQCYSAGYISAKGDNAGGITGVVSANSGDVKITDCFSYAEVASSGKNAGGIAGCGKVADGDCSVYNCYYAGKVSGSDAEASGAVTGRLECENGNGVINVMNCVVRNGSAPTLTGMSMADSMSVKNVKTASEDEMKSADTYENFDFDSVWKITEGGIYEYPVLNTVELAEFSAIEISTEE